jgi:hypothetical protein
MPSAPQRPRFMDRVRDEYRRMEKLDELEAEARREEIIQRMAEARARVEQELAIARRLQTATVVEIEETFDYRGEGKAGLQVDGKEVNLGLNGSGAKVFKRSYRFSGWREQPMPADAAGTDTGDAEQSSATGDAGTQAAPEQPSAAEASSDPQAAG